ncbi:MAG: stage III sporulation protein AF [Firmicutes bacterium]|nr:stage III sporulation protein AF [Bacillota bacterium]
MINFLKDWSINIAIIAIFITILEIIIPKGSLKGYINVIIGLILIIVLINPFINLISNNIDIEKEVFANVNSYNEENSVVKESFKELQKDQIIKTYKEKVKKNIISLVESESKYKVENINITINLNENEKDFGKLMKLKLTLNKHREKNRSNIKIEDVEVNISETFNNKNYKLTNDKKILNILSDNLNIDSNNILIYINQ